MLRATIVRMKQLVDGRNSYHVRIGKEPQTGGDVEVIEILGQKEGETRQQLDVRAYNFLLDYAVMAG
jgi:hypothetical protein